MDRQTIEQGVFAAIAETYGVDASSVTAATTWEELGNHSSKLLRFSMFVDGELDTEDVAELDELMGNATLGDTIDMIAEKLA